MTGIIHISDLWADSGGLRYRQESPRNQAETGLDSIASLETPIHTGQAKKPMEGKSKVMKILVTCENGHSEVITLTQDLDLDFVKLIDGTSPLIERTKHFDIRSSMIGKCGICWKPFRCTLWKDASEQLRATELEPLDIKEEDPESNSKEK